MLKCENPKMEKKTLAAFRALHPGRSVKWSAWFEHGQLWICGTNGAQYSVVDAEGPGSVDGFDFELVTEPDED